MPEDIEGIDLSSWRVAFNGAEPVKAHVIDAFSRKFAPYGFRAEAFYPCYGLAESTLFVTGGVPAAPAVRLAVDPEELRANRVGGAARVADGAGGLRPHQPGAVRSGSSTRSRCASCPTDTSGRFGSRAARSRPGIGANPSSAPTTFAAQTADGEGPFLRTGDLGFLKDGELFVSGRLKDLIIIRGRNYYPDDIESAVYQGRPSLRPGGAAAFTLPAEGHDKLVVVAEVQRTFLHRLDTRAFQALLADVRGKIADLFGLRLAQLILIRPGSIPRTSSGKLRRLHCRELHQNDQLQLAEIHQLEAPAGQLEAPSISWRRTPAALAALGAA